jgi:flagellar FliJ protein
MKRLQLLQLLLEKEQGLRDAAQAGMLAAVRQADAAQVQLDGLAVYRTEYHKRWSAQFAQGAAMDIVRCYHGFIARLDQAIAQQQGSVRMAQAGVEIARKRLVEREIRVATVERLIQRRQALLARIADRREAKNLDEMAQRRSPAADLVGFD